MATATLKDHLRGIKRGRPGHRFQDHYRREKNAKDRRRSTGRFLRLGLGIASVIVGIILCVIPGPGLPFVFLGGGLLATESLVIARFMDWLELWVRAAWLWARQRWKILPWWARAVLVTVIVCGSVASGYFFYRLMPG